MDSYAVHIKTRIPADFFSAHLSGSYKITPLQTDIGCVHGDFIHIDTKKTLQNLDQFYQNHTPRVAAESRWLAENRIDLVISDASGFPLKSASQLGIPRLLMSNFTWYDIYSAFPEAQDHKTTLDLVRDEYACATLQFLPQCSINGDAVKNKETVGFIGLSGNNIRNELQRLYPSQIEGKTLVYIYFGEFATSSIQWANLETMTDCVFITPDALVPASNNLLVVRDRFSHPDLIASADVVFTKAGYSTLATSLIHGKPVISCDRSGFCEVDAIKEYMAKNQIGLIIESNKFYAGNWSEAINTARNIKRNAHIRFNGETDIINRVDTLLAQNQ